MAATCKMNSYGCVQRFAKGPDTKAPSSVWSLAFSASQQLLPHPLLTQSCATNFSGDGTEPHLRCMVGSLCRGLSGRETCKQLSVNGEVSQSLTSSANMKINPVMVLISFSQKHIGDLYNCCCQIFVEGSQLHDIIQTFTACRLF